MGSACQLRPRCTGQLVKGQWRQPGPGGCSRVGRWGRISRWQGIRLCRGGTRAPLSPSFLAELHTERSLHRDPAPAAEHHARLLAAGLRLRVHLHRHAQPAAPVQLRLGEGLACRVGRRAGGLPAAQGPHVFKGTSEIWVGSQLCHLFVE